MTDGRNFSSFYDDEEDDLEYYGWTGNPSRSVEQGDATAPAMGNGAPQDAMRTGNGRAAYPQADDGRATKPSYEPITDPYDHRSWAQRPPMDVPMPPSAEPARSANPAMDAGVREATGNPAEPYDERSMPRVEPRSNHGNAGSHGERDRMGGRDADGDRMERRNGRDGSGSADRPSRPEERANRDDRADRDRESGSRDMGAPDRKGNPGGGDDGDARGNRGRDGNADGGKKNRLEGIASSQSKAMGLLLGSFAIGFGILLAIFLIVGPQAVISPLILVPLVIFVWIPYAFLGKAAKGDESGGVRGGNSMGGSAPSGGAAPVRRQQGGSRR